MVDIEGPNKAKEPVHADLEPVAPEIEARIEEVKRSDALKVWNKDNRAVDQEGDPIEVYHGTTHDVQEFTKDRANVENDYGAAFYFTTSPDDVGINYAAEEGPDLTIRVDQRKEQIEQEIEQIADDQDPQALVDTFGISLDEANEILDTTKDASGDVLGDIAKETIAMRLARQEISGGAPNVIPAFLNFKEPFVVGDPVMPGGNDQTWLTIERDDEYYKNEAKEEVDEADHQDDEGNLDQESYDDAIQEKADEIYYEDYDPKEDGNGVAFPGCDYLRGV